MVHPALRGWTMVVSKRTLEDLEPQRMSTMSTVFMVYLRLHHKSRHKAATDWLLRQATSQSRQAGTR
jgi:diadenosine tetraphosphate (Ap4A) HIT family hydrolase